LERCAIDQMRLAEVPPVDETIVGTVDKAIAGQLGITNDVLVARGGHDQACAALGSGVIEPGLAMVSTGTAEVVEVAMASPVVDRKLREGNISVYRHVVPDLYLAMTLNHSGGLSLRWLRDTLCQDKCTEAARMGVDAYDLMLAGATDGPTDLLVLPHFSGAGTPLLDTRSKGAILGMTFATTQADIAKAILEGLTFELRTNLELLKSAGIRLDELHTVGGGARSGLWLQLKADICQIRLRVPQVTEAACLGAAILASVAAGTYPNVSAAVSDAVSFDRTVEPTSASSAAYENRYQLYVKLYPTLAPLHHQLD
jgi:xylulokinase